MRVAVVGVTGMVGQVMLSVLEERNFPITELIPVASERSVGKEISFKGKVYKEIDMELKDIDNNTKKRKENSKIFR